ncbi:MAG TPA: S8 family serine peptidase [Thermoanaerobaculia bacterium]|nr:S8 family serine peptidase [Thermoanaerobaculia bacterium]
MSVAYVIHCDADLDCARKSLTRPLPSRGFDRWVSSVLMRSSGRSSLPAPEVMAACQVILAVISRSAAVVATDLRDEIELGLKSPCPMLVIRLGALDDRDCERFPEQLWQLPQVDFNESGAAYPRQLGDLLPPAASGGEPDVLADVAETIEWNEEIFSEALAEALYRHDHSRAVALLGTLAHHVERRPYAYPEKHANADLAALRRERQFKLMQRYSEAVLASGTKNERVRRQYAQSLIEQREFAHALAVLESIVEDERSDPGEVDEARGLIGRACKQQYVDNPAAPEAPAHLRRAIAAYESVYSENPARIWHGINTAACLLRAHRDGLYEGDARRARAIAREVLERIAVLEVEGRLDVWDYATRVEAFVALEQYEAAPAALTTYLIHPGMHAFEVSSTHRQFEQLWRLDEDPRGRPLLDRLSAAVERYRAGSVTSRPESRSGVAEPGTGGTSRSLVIRVTDPHWQPAGVADLVVEERLGTIVSARGSEASVKGLLRDPGVVSIDESLPAGSPECSRSMPFVGVAASYPGSAGPYAEKGEAALIAFIDNGIDVLHEAFQDASGQTRIVGIWDQTDPTGPPPAGFSGGTYHDAAALNGYIRSGQVLKNLGRNLTGDGHGTHVASIAAGRAVGSFAGGVAPEAQLLVVIPDSQGWDGYWNSHIKALSFIDAMATALGLPVVVNMSQGLNAGAHDGKSALEVAFDEFSKGGRAPGRLVVKSAGNEGDKRGHAKVVLAPEGADELVWERYAGAQAGERLELWWSLSDELDFQLCHPAGEWTPWVGKTNPKEESTFATGEPYRLQLVHNHVDNGDNQLIIEIGDFLSPAPAGVWRLRIESRNNVPMGGEIHAWIERGLGTASAFVSRHASADMTLSIPGTARTVITVGAVEAVTPVVVGTFSSYGPTRDNREKPELAAPGVRVEAAQSGTSTGIVSKCGTSMAAPHVTGAIALLLSREKKSGRPIPAASQISATLRQKASYWNSRWNPGRGFGVMNVGALLAAF